MEETTRPEGGHTAEAQTITQEQTRDDVQVGETMSGGQEVNMIELCDRSVAPWEGEGDGDLSDTTTISVDTYTMDSETNSMDQSLPTEGLDSPRGVLTAWVQTEAGEGEPSRGQDKSDSDVPEHQNPPRTPGSGNGSRAVVVTNPLMASPGQALLTSLSPAVPQPGPPGQVTHSPLYPSINMPSLGSASQHRLVPEVPNAVPDPSTPEFPSSPSPAIFTISGDDKSPLYWDEACVIEMRILQKTELPNGAPLTEGGPPLAERCDSTLSSLSEKLDICRICHCEGEESNKLISPCLCSGSLKFIHLTCLQKWIKSSDKKACELCNFDYIMTTKTRPFKQWEKLEMTAAERRKIVCSVTFHIIAITCVIWSLYVLIDRSTEEVHSGTLDWPFWTKLIVVAIGFTGGLVFMYVQCKMYVQLCFRWRQFNKLINIENAPEDPDLRAEAAARIKAKSNEKAGVVNTVALAEVDSF